MSTPPKDQKVLVIIDDPQINYLLERVLQSAGFLVETVHSEEAALQYLQASNPAVIILSDAMGEANGVDIVAHVSDRYPAFPILLLVQSDSPELLKAAIRAGIADYLTLPLKSDSILSSVQTVVSKSQKSRDWVLLESRRATDRLQRRVDELETLARLSQSVTSTLDSDAVLSAIVEAAVMLTDAEEGNLLLLDEASGEMYMRAAKNFQEDFVRTFRLPIQDTLAGSVLRTGQPVVLDESTPQKIKTSYLVHALIYVPLKLRDKVFGVLGVDNRHTRLPFSKRDVSLLATLAEYAVIALVNADLYNEAQAERNKLETVLKKIQDGVIVIDNKREIILINQAAESAINLALGDVTGKLYQQVISQPELLELMDTNTRSLSNRTELTVEDGRVFGAQRTPIPDVGTALTLHDITYLKKLDRIKSEFVSTVSHDLRSPLTAILGYAELIERAGPVNELQQEFIRRVQTSVQNITHLVDDLVNLGRIEAGFDTRKESFDLRQVFELATDNFRKALERKNNQMDVNLPENLPPFYGNPVQLRQMFEHLLDNAIKYSNPNGKISIYGELEQNQVILQIKDEGIGIPAVDLPFIFDKFYRASNLTNDASGTGLGLAIVKSIVESHEGRVWVESTVGQGTTFTIVLPIVEP
jgi:two-component system phosphate regulon sensor histidine kinase PhoR